ncbi:MAG: beta-N-acetylhexosaminidase [Proteiniphilum sp.]|nr:beta-N-acetylhexosaminidase [Proteiniphilum sp.]
MSINSDMKITTLSGLLAALLLLSCNTEKKNETLQLLPQPQMVTIFPSGRHPLHQGIPDPSVVAERRIIAIPEAEVNSDEAYRLRITPDSIIIEATTEKGIYWARQTLNQIIASSEGNTLPTLEITDWPAFRVRGFMHDVGRSFISVEELKKQISLLSQYKINVFHWHLTENEGWRLESRRYPQLNDSSSFTRLPGKYYTMKDAHEIATHCKAHNMLLIPEIDMPGHSASFVHAMGVDMQSEKGMKILKDLMEEICTEVFPELPYIHIGTDEVEFTNPDFVPEMVKHIRGMGKKLISWYPGWNYQPGEIDATQLWSYRGKAQPGIPAIDSRFHYINHFDAFGDIVALYNSRIYDTDRGSDDIAGTILAIWNDRLLEDEEQIIVQNYFYPNMLALAERSWLGGGSEYFDKNGVILPADEKEETFRLFADFERRMLCHKKHNFANESFPYVQQTQVKWHITDPFPNGGDLSAVFPPEKALSDSYSYNGQTYTVRPAIGASIYLRHVWGNIVPAFYEDPQENHTAYAYTSVWSPKTQTVGLWVSTQDYSRSESDLPPPQGEWDYRGSRIFINDKILSPPVWKNRHTERTNEITLKNENFTARPPMLVNLKKGWNKVLLKLPVGKFSTPEVRLQKWMFTFVFVTPDGKDAMPGLIYDPSKIKEQ